MRLKSRLILLGMILTFSSAVVEAAQEMSCRAVKKGVEHVAKITVSNDKIESFSYVSVRKNGHTCEVVGSRQEAESSWLDEQDNRMLVSLFFSGQEIAKVSLQNANSEFTIKILTPITSVCGVKGYIAKTVVITANKRTCSLGD